MDIAETREAIADVLNAAVEDLNIRPRKPVKTPQMGDGWVTLGVVRPSTYTECTVTLTTLIVLGSDVDAADERFEELAVVLVDAVTTADELNVADVVLEPLNLITEGGASMYALTLTLTAEVEARA